MRFRVDDPAPQVRAILAECRLGPDPGYIGELKRLFENRGYRRMYYRRDGLQLDQLGERMLDRGLVSERPTPDELLCYLDDLLRPEERRRGRRPATAAAVDAAERKARGTRLRLYECACGQKARGTRSSLLICGLCYEMHGEIRFLERKDPLPEEILAQAAATMCEAAS